MLTDPHTGLRGFPLNFEGICCMKLCVSFQFDMVDMCFVRMSNVHGAFVCVCVCGGGGGGGEGAFILFSTIEHV